MLRDEPEGQLAQGREVRVLEKVLRRAAARPSMYTFPSLRRSRRASGVRSTSSIWSASPKTESGTVSWTRAPVICQTASARLSMCWTLSVV
jgi:hypothetical protein